MKVIVVLSKQMLSSIQFYFNYVVFFYNNTYNNIVIVSFVSSSEDRLMQINWRQLFFNCSAYTKSLS